MNLPLFAIALTAISQTAPWLVTTEQHSASDRASIVVKKPGVRVELGSFAVRPGLEPFASLSPDGRSVFLAQPENLNHPERSAKLARFDLVTREYEIVAEGVDAAPVLPLGRDAVAWTETLGFRRATEEQRDRGFLDSVELSIRASIGGTTRELARLDDVYGVHFAGVGFGGLVLYVVSRAEAAFYVLPLDAEAVAMVDTPVKRPRAETSGVRASVESKDPSVAPSGLIRRAAAPTGPFARDFSVIGDALFFSALTFDRDAMTGEREQALFALDLSEAAAEDGRVASLVTKTGLAHPSPLLASGRLLYSMDTESKPKGKARSHSITALAVRSKSAQSDVIGLARRSLASHAFTRTQSRSGPNASGDTLDGQPMKRVLVKTAGMGRALAYDAPSDSLVMRRVTATDADVLWIDGLSKKSYRLNPRREVFFGVLGFAPEEVQP